MLGFQCESTNGYEHSLFYPYNLFFIIVLFYPQSASAFYPRSEVCSLQINIFFVLRI